MRKLPYKTQGHSPMERVINEIIAYLESLRPMESPGVLTSHTSFGVSRKAQPSVGGGSSVGPQLLRFKSMEDDYLVCRSWDGTTEGSTDILVAKPFKLRFSITTETLSLSGGAGDVVFTYSAWSTTEQQRQADGDNGLFEIQVIAPRYLVNDLIYASKATTLVNDGDGNPITLKDDNDDGREWVSG